MVIGTSAYLGGELNPGGEAKYYFEYGTTTWLLGQGIGGETGSMARGLALRMLASVR